jgi:hypothetical protein
MTCRITRTRSGFARARRAAPADDRARAWSRAVLTSSEFSKEIAERLGIPADHIHVIIRASRRVRTRRRA